jgi:hypothetical protein
MSYSSLANNQTISFNNLQDGVNTGQLSQKAPIPVSNEQITKADANTYININTDFAPYAAKASNQLVVKSNLQSVVSVRGGNGMRSVDVDNNESTFSPIQLYCGFRERFTTGVFPNIIVYSAFGEIYRSTDYGATIDLLAVNISDFLFGIRYMPNFRHASYLTVVPFLSVGDEGRIITNSVTDCSSWITISSPTTRALYAIAFNFSVGIIVGNGRILKTNTNNRINSWSIINSVASVWRAVATDGSSFVAVGDNNAVITGDSLGTTWTVRSLVPLSLKNLTGITYHTDGFWYAVGFETSDPTIAWIMRSTNGGVNWSQYVTTGESFIGSLHSIKSINGKLYIGGRNYQYEINNGVVTRYNATLSGRDITWTGLVKDANSNGFDMTGFEPDRPATSDFIFYGFYSNF